MNIFHVILGKKSHEGTISVEMCNDEFFLKHALPWTALWTTPLIRRSARE